jgi:hypothetical protein
MGQLGALGRPGRARRVEDHRSISVLAHDGFHKGLGCADHLLEVARGDHDALGAGGLWKHTLRANVTANLIRNYWSYMVDFCGHFPDGAEKFTRE